MKTGIVFPCVSIESKLDAHKLIHLISEQKQYHFCFVNDCSSDKTIKFLNSISDKIPHRISIIHLEKNSGKSESLRAGVQFLQGLSFINYIGILKDVLDSDFDNIKSMVKTLHYSENLSIIFGLEQNDKKLKAKEKHFLFQLFLRKCSFGKELDEFLKLKDSTIVFSKSITPILFDSPFLSKHFFYLEILLRLKLLFGEKNLNKFILIKKLKLKQTHRKPLYLNFYQSLNFPILLFRFCINYTILSNGHLLIR